MSNEYEVISLFSGCGGMDLGFRGGFEVFGRKYRKMPFKIVWANDLNKAACRTYAKNIGPYIRQGDIWKLIKEVPEKVDVVVGGFPCQDISINGKRAGIEGKRSGLYRAMVNVIKRCEPKVFVAENVKGLLMKHSIESLRQVVDDFEALEYNVQVGKYLAADYGVPQSRERVFIVGTRAGLEFVQPERERHSANWMSAQQAIDDLRALPETPAINHVWSRARKSPEQGSRRLVAHRPAQTIRAECHGNIQYHYSLPRRISMREAARFQSFPDTFIFDAGLRETERMVGNAVPPVLAWHVAEAVIETLEGRRARRRSVVPRQTPLPLIAKAV